MNTALPKPKKEVFARLPAKDLGIRALKFSGKPVTYADGAGLFLVVSKTKKAWRVKSRLHNGEQYYKTIGSYPAMLLADARQKQSELRELIAKGLDPRQVEKDRIQEEQARQASTLKAVASEWFDHRSGFVTDTTLKKIRREFEINVFPLLGNVPVADITAKDVFALVTNIEKDKPTVARSCKSNLARVFSFAIKEGLTARNPSAELITSETLKPRKITHHASIGTDEIKKFLDALENDGGTAVTKFAIKLIMMMFMRKSELRQAEWSHIDLKAGLWTVPADNTKKRREQVYPLPRQAVAILDDLRRYTGRGKYVFSTGARKKDAPMSINTLNAMINRSGFYKRMTPHGFRALATSWLDEQGYSRQAIERQLSHIEKGQTNQAYHRADYMEERRQMLQTWADYLESLRNQNTNQEPPQVIDESQQAGDKAA